MPSCTQTSFGTLADGTGIERYCLRNRCGMNVSVLTLGATLQSIRLPADDSPTGEVEVVLGFDRLEGYLSNHPFFGAIIGRYANRIRDGKFTLDGCHYQIPCNEEHSALHGGAKGFDKRIWKAEPFETESECGVEMSYRSPHNEMGFPGTLDVSVRYTLDDNNTLKLDYCAQSDTPTVINLTNHSYFNLAGHGNIRHHIARINASTYTPVDMNLLPTGELLTVEGTPFDFRQPMALGQHLETNHPQLNSQNGYDINLVLDKPDLISSVASITDPQSGRILNLFTTLPGLQLYTANALDGSLSHLSRRPLDRYAGFTLETQLFPDTPHHPHFPSARLDPDQRWAHTTCFQFITS